MRGVIYVLGDDDAVQKLSELPTALRIIMVPDTAAVKRPSLSNTQVPYFVLETSLSLRVIEKLDWRATGDRACQVPATEQCIESNIS